MIAKHEKGGMGDEPMHTEPIDNENDIRLSQSFNWYNYFYKISEARPWVVQYMKAKGFSDESISLFKKARDSEVDSTICWISRMINQGMIVPDNLINKMHSKITSICSKQTIEREIVEDKKPTIQDRLREKNNSIISEIEDAVDAFMLNDFVNVDFEPYKLYQTKIPSSRTIFVRYEKLLEEIDLALKGDPEVAEGYRNIKKLQIKRYRDFIALIVDDADKFFNNKTISKVKTPRKKKEKSAIQLTSKVQYKKDDSTLKIVSANPVNIIGAQSVWLFEVKTRKITNIVSDSPSGLSIKGTTIINIDMKTSTSKIVRKPETFLPEVINGGKIQLRKLMTDLTTKEIKVTGRINDNTVILRCIK
jgi:hypothetical protein